MPSVVRCTLVLCVLAACAGESEGEDPACTEGDVQCNGDILEECDGEGWATVQDCAAEGMVCMEDMGHCMDMDMGGGSDMGSDTGM